MSDSLVSLEKRRGLRGLAQRLTDALDRAGGSPAASESATAVLDLAASDPAVELKRTWSEHPGELVRALVALLVHAPFFAGILQRHPEWLRYLARDELSKHRSAAEYGDRLDALPWQDLERGPDVLRAFKYYELARITVRELDLGLVPDPREGEVLRELSALADVLLDRALLLADTRLRHKLGDDAPRDSVPGFVVLALGKLGAEELNYSSDVDLVYAFDGDAAAADLGLKLDNASEYFTRLAQELSRIVTRPSEEGFLYRIDLELRPEGNRGQLVVAGTSFVEYYDTHAATWEGAAAMKARPVAGDLAFGWRLIRALDPMLYRSSVDYDRAGAIQDLKAKFQETADSSDGPFNVKLGAGGIREVETIAQALQLLHGGRIPQIRLRATEAALEALREVHLLDEHDADALLAAYRFLRRLEHRVQMIAERQTHTLPEDEGERRRLAASFGLDLAGLDERLGAHRRAVLDPMKRLFPEDTIDRILGFFLATAPDYLANPATREPTERLARHFASQIENGPNPQRALNNLERFVDGIGHRRFYYELLLDRPELVPRLTNLFATSEHLSAYLATYPRLIEPIFSDAEVLLLTREQLAESFAGLRRELIAQSGDSTEAELDALRLFHHRELVNVGLLDLSDKVSRAEAEAALTEIGEVCLDGGLELARAQLAKRQAPAGAEFLVVGMGKLASRELTYGSDLDVIFLYDQPGASEYELGAAQDYFVRLAQKLIWALCTRTASGVCYEVDARLRPSGNQGPLVTSMSTFGAYHAASAQTWERQALLRARPVAGSATLGAAFERARREILHRPLPASLTEDIHHVRQRMEGELARETLQRHDFKTGRGGLLDIECVVQLLQLRHAAAQPRLLEVKPIAAQIDALIAVGVLEESDGAILRDGWEFLQRLSSRMRIVENRSISDLDEERGDLESVARALGYTSPQRSGGAKRSLLEDYRRHTTAIREVYERFLGSN